MFRKFRTVLLGITMFAAASASQANILVGQCIEFAPCWTSGSPTPWSDTLTGADLAALGLGTTQDFIAAQTSAFIIRLGVTTIVFTTSGAPVVEVLGEFSGSLQSDPCAFCEVDIVGTFFIPADALSAVISGTFGNTTVSNSAGVNLCLGDGPCGAAVPEPASLALLAIGVAGLGFSRRRELN